MALLPEKNLQRAKVAKSNHAFQIREALLQTEFQQVIRSVTASQSNQPVNLFGIQRPKKTICPLQRRPGKVPFRFGILIRDHLKTMAFQFGKPGDHFDRLRRRRRSEHAQARTSGERFGLARSPVASRHSCRPSKGITSVITPWRLSWER